jgi:putative endonuclease
MEYQFAVYILASRSRVLYVGVTRNLALRLRQHRSGEGSGFAEKYKTDRLVHVEFFVSLMDAVAREKQIKRWNRAKKEALIRAANPEWEDLAR